jgi:transposase-like protein
MSRKNRRFTAEFRAKVAGRISQGESVTALGRELAIKRSVLYRWRDAFRKDGEAGVRNKIGRPPGASGQRQLPSSASPLEIAQQRIAELERKIGQQELENDFLKRAFKRVEDLRRNKLESGATASTLKSSE